MFLEIYIMGKIRISQDPLFRLSSSMFGFGDCPEEGMLLLDDICQTVLIKNEKQGFSEMYSYDDFLNNQCIGRKVRS